MNLESGIMEKEKRKSNNYAFIDFHNLFFAIKSLGWFLDYKKFRVYLKDKYGIEKAYLFLGYVEENQQFYNFLQSCGYILVFKPVFFNKEKKIKGNCDAELVLQSMIDFSLYEKAILVTGDGDFYCLVKYLDEKNKLLTVLAPSTKNLSSLLTRVAKKKIVLVSDLREKIEYKKRTS